MEGRRPGKAQLAKQCGVLVGQVNKATGGRAAPATNKVNQAAGGVAKTGSGAVKGAAGTAGGAAKNVSGTAGGAVGNLTNTGKQTGAAIKRGDIKGTASGECCTFVA